MATIAVRSAGAVLLDPGASIQWIEETGPNRGLSGDTMNAFTSDGGMPSFDRRSELVIEHGSPDLQVSVW
ncbi:hypothetical protein CS8_077430 [Cupriavidus sp. 8B]